MSSAPASARPASLKAEEPGRVSVAALIEGGSGAGCRTPRAHTAGSSLISGQEQPAITKEGSFIAEDNLAGLADVLNDHAETPGQVITEAPILGDKLLKVVDVEDTGARGAASVHSLQDQVEGLRTELEVRFHEVEERFRRRWFDISFDEVEIENDFRKDTFHGQKRYMYAVTAIFTTYYTFTIIYFDAIELGKLSGKPPPMVSASKLTCHLETNTTLEIPNNTTVGAFDAVIPDVDVLTFSQLQQLSYSTEEARERLVGALIYRVISMLLMFVALLALKVSSRRVALATMVLVSQTAIAAPSCSA